MKLGWSLIIVSGAILAGVVWYESHPTNGPAPGSIITVPARLADIESVVLASGIVEPAKLVSVGAQVSGRLLSLKVALGDHVKPGQLIAEIDDVPQGNVVRKDQAIVAAIKAQRDRAQATFKQAQLAFKRQSEILAGKAGTRTDYEKAEADLAGAKADLALYDANIDSASVDVDIARTDLSYTKITAPIDGTVVAILTKQGQTVIASQIAPVIVKLADLRTMTVKAKISEADVTRLALGQSVHFTILSQPGRRYDAILRTVEPAPDQILADASAGGATGSGSQGGGGDIPAIYFNGRFDVGNADGVLRPFMTAEVSFVLGAARQAIVVPSATLRDRKGTEAHLQVVGADGVPHDRIVRTGVDGGTDVQIVEGLSLEERVILSGPGDVEKLNGGSF